MNRSRAVCLPAANAASGNSRIVTSRRMKLPLARQRNTITDGNQAQPYALVGMQLLVEGTDRQSVRVLHLGIDHTAMPEHIVDGDQAAGADQLQRTLVIGV